MRSSLFEFGVAVSGLTTARAGLNVTSNNIANASNKGYSKQYVEQRAARPLSFYNGRGMTGTGSEVYGVGQLRSVYLDNKYWHEKSIQGEYEMKVSQLNLTETIFSGMSETGVTGLFDNLFQTIQDLSHNASDDTYRTNVVAAAESLAKQTNSGVEALKSQQADINSEIGTIVQIMNSTGNQIVSLNRQISTFEIDGSRANDLRDQRTRLLDELSKYINVEVREEEMNNEYALGKFPEPEDRGRSDKRMTILINGEEFINHHTLYPLRVQEREAPLFVTDSPKLYDIYYSGSNKKLDLYSPELKGELKGLIDIRDGNNTYYCRPTNAGYTPLSDEIGQLRLENVNKSDLGKTGMIELTDVTGARATFLYEDMVYYPDNENPEKSYMTVNVKKPRDFSTFDTFANGAKVEIGRSTSYKGIPHYMNKLNELVRTFARAMNEGTDRNGQKIEGVQGYMNGFDSYGNTGNYLFTFDESVVDSSKQLDYYLMNAENFQVSSALKGDPKKLSASNVYNSGESNNNIILQFMEIKNSRNLFVEGKVSDFIVGISGELGIDVKQSKNFNVNYTEVAANIDNQRTAVSGVDINEEMVEMTKYQQLYQASAKLVNVIDSIYDTCINRLGV